jgi:hypothetical protein
MVFGLTIAAQYVELRTAARLAAVEVALPAPCMLYGSTQRHDVDPRHQAKVLRRRARHLRRQAGDEVN